MPGIGSKWILMLGWWRHVSACLFMNLPSLIDDQQVGAWQSPWYTDRAKDCVSIMNTKRRNC